MKRITILIALLYTLTSFSQIDYPVIHIDSLGKSVITMTIEQAQILDNKAELLELFKKANLQMGDVDSMCIRVINEKDEVIVRQEIHINELKVLIDNKDEQIENLQKRIKDYLLKEVLFKNEIDNKDKEINLHLKEIRRVKMRSLISGITGGVLIMTLTAVLIIN